MFALPGDKIAAIDFGIMGRIDRRARVWLAEILYRLLYTSPSPREAHQPRMPSFACKKKLS
ncbi:hypothetical protein [Salmonella enterica]|uniref:hypothetical protein n=1 Tax=Salmonella enterica TaxID=28901 RepID=UPI00398C56D0